MTKDPILKFMAEASDVPYPKMVKGVMAAISLSLNTEPALKRLGAINYRIPSSHMSWNELRNFFTMGYASVDAMFGIANRSMSVNDQQFLSDSLGAHTGTTVVAKTAAKFDFPFWIVSKGLCEMLGRTDALADPNINEEARLPFKSCYFVLPSNLIQVGGGDYLTVIGCADLTIRDIENCGFRVPDAIDDPDSPRFYVVAYTSNGHCIYSKLPVSPEGVVSDPSSEDFVMYKEDGLTIDDDKQRNEAALSSTNLAVGWALKLLTAMNAEPELADAVSLIKHRRAKREKRELSFLQPRWLGLRIRNESSHHRGDGGGSVQMHWRRGHMARRRCGKGRAETRLVFIRPTLVNAPESAEKI